jgi:thioredoxin-related protein
MLVFQVAAQGKVEFFQGTWQEAFAKAEKEDKHVFVDSYTDWCYWCKVMDKETFTDQAIADYLNAEFVPIKVDMEKGFGVDVAMKFRVRGFPTLLYFNPGGQILAKVPGYEQDKGKFLDHLKKIRADRREQPYGFASQDFDVDYPDFVEGVFARNGKRERTDAATVDAWLDGQKDLYSEQAWTALTQCPTGEKYKTQVLENGEKYAAKYGAEEFNDFVVSTVYGKVSKAGKEKSKEQYDAAITMLNTYMTDEEGKKDMAENFEFSYLKATEDWRGYTMKADEKLKTQSLDEQLGFANSVAWTLYEKCEDKECLKMMEKWMNKVIEMDPQYMYIDTYAALLYKNGDLAEAKKYAEKAIEVGKTDDSNTEETAALLVKIEEGIRDSK